MTSSEEIVREMRSEWPDRQTGMIANLRVDVAGYPVIVKGECARDHLEGVNREFGRLRLENTKLRARIAELEADRAWRPITEAKEGQKVLATNGSRAWVGEIRNGWLCPCEAPFDGTLRFLALQPLPAPDGE